MRRVWILERELLFWSLLLACSFVLFDRHDFSVKLLIKSFAPLTFDKWWYVTAYAIFLLLLPFLSQGLRLLGRKRHLELAVISLCLWGVTSFIPGAVRTTEYASFIYLAILISAYRWYFNSLSKKHIWDGILAGCAFILLYLAVSLIVSVHGRSVGIFITNDFVSIPVILIGFGIFLLFDQIPFYNPVINSIAKSSLAVYLITDYPASETLLWTRLFDLKHLLGTAPFVLVVLQIYGILLALFAACIILDYGRRGLFALTVDRHPGHWFDLLWQHLVSGWNRSAEWLDQREVLKK